MTKKPKSNVIQFPGLHRNKTNQGQKGGAITSGIHPPAPDTDTSEVANEPANFRTFSLAIMTGKPDIAAIILADMLSIDKQTALAASEHFLGKVSEDPSFFQKAMELRKHVAANKTNDGLMLIHECFSLQGPDAISAWQQIKTKFS